MTDDELTKEGLIEELTRLRERCHQLEQREARHRQAEEALRGKASQLETIHTTLLAFLGSGNWREASARLLRAVLDQTASEYGFIGVVVEGPVLRILAHEGIVWDQAINREFYETALRTYQEVGYLEFTRFENLFGRAITSGQPVLANDPPTDPRAGGLPPGHPPLRHFLGVPTLRGAEVVGLIGVANRPGGYTGTEVAQLALLTQAVGALYDCYRRHQREAALEAQLRHMQKLESIGQLAGGIAHDFNNLLTVINGYSDDLQAELRQDDPRRAKIAQIRLAGERAATLTRRLLAFGRQQTLKPVIVELNHVVTEMAEMLRRVIGEHIELRLDLTAGPAHVFMDPAQLNQVIMNLILNARDAMPERGVLTIATRTVDLDAAFAHGHPGSEVGPHVLLSVQDTGIGMDTETQARIFEPFFTTKGPAKGTGLGLSTVFGIVKQSGGYIAVESARGRGTTFHIYLPQFSNAGEEAPPAMPLAASSGGTEIILLVEDEAMVRTLAREALSGHGYRVLEAANGRQAMQLVKAYQGPLHLLLSDVIMPGMNGPELAQQLKALRPDMKTLYMSAYADEVLGSCGVFSAGVNFLQKPFTPAILARKVREVLTCS
ncbi:MAG TPA: ATP-binding protein [Nitrospiraceae bacterium]|nr:ATP-binding protein [Nitrospiraceae bacterium]